MVLDKIEELSLRKNTYVIFTTDNGYHGWNQDYSPLRGGKWWMWDNGLRVPFIMSGPGIAAGSRSSVNIVGYDLLPTFADLAGATKFLSKEVDGISFKPVLMSEPVAESYVNRALYFHYPHYRESPPCSAIVMGEMKLLHFYEWPEDHFLYHLNADLGEKINLAKTNPEKAKLMHTQLMSHLQSIGGYFPKPNPKAELNAKRYDPSILDDQQEKGNSEDGDADKPTAEKK
jgi:arylsulfatase A-like enzyme